MQFNELREDLQKAFNTYADIMTESDFIANFPMTRGELNTLLSKKLFAVWTNASACRAVTVNPDPEFEDILDDDTWWKYQHGTL